MRNLMIFTAGCVIGGFIGYKIAERKFENIIDSEIAEVKAALSSQKETEHELRKQISDKNKEKKDLVNYFDITSNYTGDDEMVETDDDDIPNMIITEEEYEAELAAEEEEVHISEEEYRHMMGETHPIPVVITPEEFASNEEYDTVTLFLYKDNVLADDDYNPILDRIDLIGPDALDTFGQYEDYSVYVRNDKYKTYYEVLIDERNYDDLTGGRKK